jgi:hypothetical protein
MKFAKLKSVCSLLVAAGVLVACGGGGDNQAGSPTTFTTIPTTTTFTAPTGTPAGVCLAGGQATVFVYGGAAPYQINNTVPAYVTVDKTQVGERGGSFTLTTLALCLSTGSIVVRDALDHAVTFTVTNKSAS